MGAAESKGRTEEDAAHRAPFPPTARVRRLKTGMRVVSIPMSCHNVAAMVWVRVGSRDEAQNKGMSHFLEHMLFKGTARFPDQASVATELNSVGGVFNASTSQEWTNYYFKIPKSGDLRRALRVLGQMIRQPLLRGDDMRREKGVVVEEIRKYIDLPERKVQEITMQRTFPDNTLGEDIAGTEEDVMGYAADDVRAYFAHFYKPENMVLVLAGPNADRRDALIVEAFGGGFDATPDDPNPFVRRNAVAVAQWMERARATPPRLGMRTPAAVTRGGASFYQHHSSAQQCHVASRGR